MSKAGAERTLKKCGAQETQPSAFPFCFNPDLFRIIAGPIVCPDTDFMSDAFPKGWQRVCKRGVVATGH